MLPAAVFSDAHGRIFDDAKHAMLGFDGTHVRDPHPEELIPLPAGSDLFLLPGRKPLGRRFDSGKVRAFGRNDFACGAAAFVAPAYLRLLHPATALQSGAPSLPTFAYAALGWRQGQFWTAAVRVDPERRQDPPLFDLEEIRIQVRLQCHDHPHNRLYTHLRRCALQYGCRAAQNFFLQRWEAPLPSARTCNARCLGCLSLQPDGRCPASHDRIHFIPTPEELADVAVPHFLRVDEAVASFGQGCEGEPLLNPDLLEAAVRRIRRQTDRGTINLNTNASRPKDVARLCAAGLDSLRISIVSCRPELYAAYHQPVGYCLADVRAAAHAVHDSGRYLSLNLLVFPGVTDTEPEFAATVAFVQQTGCNLIQLRNLNVDPLPYLQMAQIRRLGPPFGLLTFMKRLRAECPTLRLGYFNPPRERFSICGI